MCLVTDVRPSDVATLTLTLSSKNRKNKIKNEKENKKKLSPLSVILTYGSNGRM